MADDRAMIRQARLIRRALHKALGPELGAVWSVVSPLGALFLNRALRRALPRRHVLDGAALPAVARRGDHDEVLYLLADGRLALVHLTGTGQSDPRWPHVAFMVDVADFCAGERREMAHVAAMDRCNELASAQPEGAFRCPDCGANWGAGDWGATCGVCGGGGLARACPCCDGACGAVWDRAVIDSIDQAEAVWIGRCNRVGPF